MGHNLSAFKHNGGVLLIAIMLMFLLAASGCMESKKNQYEQLSDQEKRSAENALVGLETREGLETTLFAAEEMLVNPTNMDIDRKGRVWVTEGFNYRPTLNPENPANPDGDRIVILEDTNSDGKADTSKVFYQGNEINSALGIMVLDNRVIVSRSPHIFILTDTDGDDKADEKEILFSGIEGEQHDHGVHAFVFGPDGKLYFNTGNEGKVINDTDGNVVIDVFGNEVKTDGNPYRQGMVFRSNMDGSEFEVLAHNFRNNYELAVDSYGTLWQSDNDDDGNKAVRINFVMEYGNYGFTDEMTGAGWRTRRTGMAEDIPTRHWYQNDPGSIPNLLQTGAGSPTGILVYEGELLPEVFHNEMIHTDAGPNIVRSYPVEKDGAGYSAHIENILKGSEDQWFRPSDVTVAPDGSIFVADWYDPGVGGHQMGDQERGRIFRIAPEGAAYDIPEFDLTTPEGAVEALKNPNLNVRANTWLKLHEWGVDAEPALNELWNSDNQRYRARALWLLSKLEEQGLNYIDQALNDDNPDIRITALRAVRQLEVDIIPYVKRLVEDPSPQVRREAAIALHRIETPEAAKLWAQLAVQHDGDDRWYLEALGIGAYGQWDLYFDEWLNEVGSGWNTEAARDIVWRSRADVAVPMLSELIKDSSIDTEKKRRYFRAFDFHTSPQVQQELVSILGGDLPDQQRLDILALNHLDRSSLEASAKVRTALDGALEATRSTYEFIDLVEKFELTTENDELISLMLAHPDSSLGVSAAQMAVQYGGKEKISTIINEGSSDEKESAVQVLGHTGSQEALDLLQQVILDENRDPELRNRAVTAMGSSWPGEENLADMVKNGLLPSSLDESANRVLSNAWRDEIRQVAKDYFAAVNEEQSTIHTASELVEMSGDTENGKKIFEQSCQICHVVNGEGTQFGPALSEIGDKFPKEGLYESIIDPNAGISFGYEGYILTMNDGSKAAGIIQSETEEEVEILSEGGFTTTYQVSEIASREQMDRSLMPAGLERGMSQQELVDLVEYLSSLK